MENPYKISFSQEKKKYSILDTRYNICHHVCRWLDLVLSYTESKKKKKMSKKVDDVDEDMIELFKIEHPTTNMLYM